MAQDGLNVLIVVVNTSTMEVLAHSSSDGGATFSPQLGSSGIRVNDIGLTPTGNQLECLAVDGRFFVGYVRPGSPPDLFIDESPYGSLSWGTDVNAATGIAEWQMACVSGSPGRIGVVWIETFGNPGSQMDFTSRDTSGSTSWSVPVGITNPVSNFGFDLVGARNTGGSIEWHIVYVLLGGTPRLRYVKGDAILSSASRVDVPIGGGAGLIGVSGAHGGPISTVSMAVSPVTQAIHAFFALRDGSDYRLAYSPLAPPTNFTYVNGLAGGPFQSTVRTVGVDPVAFASGNIVGCAWNERLLANPNSGGRLDPLYTLSEDGGANWFPEPKSMIPNSAFGDSNALASVAVVSKDSVVGSYSPTATSLEALGLITYGVLPIATTGSDAPALSGSGLSTQLPSTRKLLSLTTTYALCNGSSPILGGILLSDGANAVGTAIGSCVYLLGPVMLTPHFELSLTGLTTTVFDVDLPPLSMSNLVGVTINAQPFAIDSGCGSSCFGIGWSLGTPINFIVTIL